MKKRSWRYASGRILLSISVNKRTVNSVLFEFSKNCKLFLITNVRITEIRTIAAFCEEIFKGPENSVRISTSSNYTASNWTDLTVLTWVITILLLFS